MGRLSKVHSRVVCLNLGSLAMRVSKLFVLVLPFAKMADRGGKPGGRFFEFSRSGGSCCASSFVGFDVSPL